jgi:hypothetical protein
MSELVAAMERRWQGKCERLDQNPAPGPRDPSNPQGLTSVHGLRGKKSANEVCGTTLAGAEPHFNVAETVVGLVFLNSVVGAYCLNNVTKTNNHKIP